MTLKVGLVGARGVGALKCFRAMEATKIVVGIMERVAKINGVIPDRSLVTVDQRSVHLADGEVTFNIEAAIKAYKAVVR